MKAISNDLESKKVDFTDNDLDAIHTQIISALHTRYDSFPKNGKTIKYYRAFDEKEITVIEEEIKKSLANLGGIIYQEGPGEDVPISFIGTDLPDHLDILAEQENVSQFLDFLTSRIRTMLSDTRMKEIIGDQADITLSGLNL